MLIEGGKTGLGLIKKKSSSPTGGGMSPGI